MARKGTSTKVGQGDSTKGKKSLATAKGNKKLARRDPKELSSPGQCLSKVERRQNADFCTDPASSSSGGSVLPIEIYKGSPDRVEFPRPTKRKRKTSEPAAEPAKPAKRRNVTKSSSHAKSADSPTAPR